MVIRINNVDKKRKTAEFKLENEEQIELLNESMILLISKQEKSVQEEGNDPLEVEQLERFKKAKVKTVDRPMKKVKKKKKEKENNNRNEGVKPEKEDKDKEEGDTRPEGQEFIPEEEKKIHDVDLFVMANALNEHIALLENDNSYQNENKEKYEKLKKMLEQTQEIKSMFEHVPTKPKGFGRLRK